uniref:Rad51 domain-containing protein n=1 Tax=Strongyloides papillosus TaxID=174720 RepID=A0A0N5C1W5_STREA
MISIIYSLYRTNFNGRYELPDRQGHLNEFLNHLSRYVEEFGVAVVYTNQVMENVYGNTLCGENSIRPAGGHIIMHASTTRL